MHELMLYHHMLTDAFSYLHLLQQRRRHRILITAEYLNEHFFLSSYLAMHYKCQRRYFMQIFVNSVERLNTHSPVYSAPPWIWLNSVHYYVISIMIIISIFTVMSILHVSFSFTAANWAALKHKRDEVKWFIAVMLYSE